MILNYTTCHVEDDIEFDENKKGSTSKIYSREMRKMNDGVGGEGTSVRMVKHRQSFIRSEQM